VKEVKRKGITQQPTTPISSYCYK